MKFHELDVRKQTKPKRSGRGISAGRGKTAGRGTKGQGARKSPGRVGFEGGQTPLMARVPKLPGFKSLRPKMENIYTGQLDELKAKSVENHSLAEANLVSSPFVKVKLIFKGEVKNKKTVKLQAASSSAIKALEKAGGSFEKVEQLGRPRKPADS